MSKNRWMDLALERGDQLDTLRRELHGAKELLAMLIHSAGGELRLTPVLFRGDETITRWDDPMTGEVIFRLKEHA